MGLERVGLPPGGEFSEPEWVAHEARARKEAEIQAYKRDLNGETIEILLVTQISGKPRGLRTTLHEDL